MNTRNEASIAVRIKLLENMHQVLLNHVDKLKEAVIFVGPIDSVESAKYANEQAKFESVLKKFASSMKELKTTAMQLESLEYELWEIKAKENMDDGCFATLERIKQEDEASRLASKTKDLTTKLIAIFMSTSLIYPSIKINDCVE